MIATGNAQRIPVAGTPAAEIVSGPGRSFLACRIAVDDTSPAPQGLPNTISCTVEQVGSRYWIRIETTRSEIYREFHALACAVIDEVQLEGQDVRSAFTTSIRAWRNLLKQAQRLTAEEEIGLLGELWTLTHLVRRYGPDALKMWIGPLGEPHDFHLPAIDVEVKSTRNVHRVHMIGSLEQLNPTPGRELYVLSLQFQPTTSENGWSLPTIAALLQDVLHTEYSVTADDRLMEVLSKAQAVGSQASELYCDYYELRSVPALIPVNEQFPRLTRELVQGAMGANSYRLENLLYSVNLHGLGFESLDSQFKTLLFDV